MTSTYYDDLIETLRDSKQYHPDDEYLNDIIDELIDLFEEKKLAVMEQESKNYENGTWE